MPKVLEAQEKTEIVDRLFQVFRDFGYEGSSLSDLSQATGLSKSSLYHHFRGGKQQMAETVLDRGKEFIQSAIADTVKLREPLRVRVKKVAAAFDQMYAGGRNLCVLGRLAVEDLGSAGDRLVRDVFELWGSAIAELARESGMTPLQARQFAEDWIARLQGSLILQSASGDSKPFKRALSALTQLTEKRTDNGRSRRKV